MQNLPARRRQAVSRAGTADGHCYIYELCAAFRLDLIEGSIVPSLKLANEVSSLAGTVFVVVMICGIFSTAAPVLWTICNNLAKPGSRISLVIALLVSLTLLFWDRCHLIN